MFDERESNLPDEKIENKDKQKQELKLEGNPEKDNFPFIIKFIRSVLTKTASRYTLIPLSFFVVTISYLLDSSFGKTVYLSSSGTMVALFGVILSIKPHFLSKLRTNTDISSHYSSSYSFSERYDVDEDALSDHVYSAVDESLGVILIIVGALLSYFTPLIPLIS